MVEEKKFSMKETVDELGELRALKARIADREKVLVNDIKENGDVGTTYHGGIHDCTITASKKTTFDIPKIFTKLKKAGFLKVATVTKKALSRVMSDEEIDKVSEIVEGTPTVRTKPRRQEIAPGEIEAIRDRVRDTVTL